MFFIRLVLLPEDAANSTEKYRITNQQKHGAYFIQLVLLNHFKNLQQLWQKRFFKQIGATEPKIVSSKSHRNLIVTYLKNDVQPHYL